jgi:hypothetical protein
MAQKTCDGYQARRQSTITGLCSKGRRVVARSSLTASFMFFRQQFDEDHSAEAI